MSGRHLLYFTAGRVVLYRWSHGRLALESSYANSEEGAAAFAGHLRGVPKDLFYLLVDIVEEDFHQENVPFVRGKDRQALLGRKLAQRYRDTSLSLALSLGFEKTQRRDERILFSAFTNNQQFQPWLAALAEHELPVVGVFSVALMAPRLAAKIGPKKAPALLVTLQTGGLRQSYIENGRIRFSRLGPLEPADAADPARVAAAFERETGRVQQYLTAMRVLGRDGAVVDAVLVAPPGEKQRVAVAAAGLPQFRVSVFELGEAAAAIGLKGFPEGAGAEVLFLHLLAINPTREQYAGPTLRQYFHLRQVRKGLVAGGAVLGAAGLLWSGVQLAQYFALQEKIAVDRQRAELANDGFARVTAGLPPLPTSPENLRLAVQKHSQLVKHTVPPERLIADISRALEASPRIELERVRWALSTTHPKEQAAEAGARATGAPPRSPTPQAPKGGLFEIAEIEGMVAGAKVAEHRLITETVNGFAERLGKGAGVEVVQVKLPFAFGSQERLSGDFGGKAATSDPKFTVVVTRKVPE
jgi:hypothetical protein